MKFRLYGASDDLAEVDGDISGELGCYDRDVEVRIGARRGPGCIATLSYGGAGVWEVGVRQLDEGVPILGSLRVEAEGYSAVLCVEVPDGTPVVWRCVGKDEDDDAWQVPD